MLLQRLLLLASIIKLPINEPVAAVHEALAGQGYQAHALALAGLVQEWQCRDQPAKLEQLICSWGSIGPAERK